METGLPSLRVLIADDNPAIRNMLAGMLRSVGIDKIREVSSGAEGLEAIRRWTADIAFVDLQMAPIDGIEFTRTVRTNTTDPYMPIIILTGHAQLDRVKEARDAGATDFLVKPLNPEVVVARLKAVIARQRPFVRSETYVGPDRRRRASPDYAGPWRRASDRPDRRQDAG